MLMKKLITWWARRSSLLQRNCPWEEWQRAEHPAHAIGHYGENVAARWLQAQGLRVLYRNFRGPHGGELDIVAREGRTLLFIEVKTRSASLWGRPLDAVDRDKQQLIERGADSWLRLLGHRNLPWRFDVIEIIVAANQKPHVTWVRDAF